MQDCRRTVVVADGHVSSRAAIGDSLEARDFKVVANATDRVAAVAAVLRYEPDIALIDVLLPGGGISAAADLQAVCPRVAVVMLASSSDDRHLFGALRAGARGYLLKDIDPERLPAALTGVLNGEAAVPRMLVARLITEYQTIAARRVTTSDGTDGEGDDEQVMLTPRELEVLQLLRAGSSTAEVGRILGLAPVTVRSHVAAGLQKLRVTDRQSAFALLDRAALTA